jgi:phospholipase C
MFYHSAQSDGWCTNPYDAYYVEGYPWESNLHKLQVSNVTYKVYMMDDVSTTLFFKDQRTPEALVNYHNFSKFLEDCANGTLASYNVIEPRYFSIPEAPATDEHPSDHTIYEGELMFKTIYDALRASPLWESSALLIFYDEHGGLYDHVPSPNSGIPDPNPGQTCNPFGGDPTFDFSRLGIRIPAFIVSPWVPKGLIEHYPTGASAPTSTSQYEHSSVSRTLHDLFNLDGFLTQRDQWAATLVPLFNLTQPRTDCPLTMPNPPRTAALDERRRTEWQLPLNDFQQTIITGYAAMNGDIYHGEGIENQYEGHEYVVGQWKKFLERKGL